MKDERLSSKIVGEILQQKKICSLTGKKKPACCTGGLLLLLKKIGLFPSD